MTVEVALVPGETAVGVVAAMLKSGTAVVLYAVMKPLGHGIFILEELTHVPPPYVPSNAPVVVGKAVVAPLRLLPDVVSPVT